MGDIIGFKGSADDRLLAWITMVELRKSIKWAQAQPEAEFFTETIDMERNLYQKEFTNYLAA